MLTFIKSHACMAGALGGMFALSQVTAAAGPLESSENPNERGLKNTLIGAQERPQYQGGQQAQQQPATGAQRVVANKLTSETSADREIAEWLSLGADEEVQLAKLAESHAKNSKVIDFAKEMQQAHSKQWQELERFAPRDARAFSQQPNATQTGRPALESARGGLNYMEVQKQIAAECLASHTRELNAKQGTEFDRAYIGSQIGAHMHMIDTCKVLRNYASPELQKVVDNSLQTAERHVDEAKTLMRSLDQH
jgi:predicted outer membrane protein